MSVATDITFGIPLVARDACADWERVEELLGQTLRSLLGSGDPGVAVILACEDRPDLEALDDPRVTVLSVRARAAVDLHSRRQNRNEKFRAIGAELRSRGGGLLMSVDSDDLVSRRLPELLRAHPDCHGFFLPRGYLMDVRTGAVVLSPSRGLTETAFNAHCGPSWGVRWGQLELPTAETRSELFDRCRTRHRFVPEVMAEAGRPLLEIDEPLAVYRLGTGVAISDGCRPDEREHLVAKVNRLGRPHDEAFAREFGLA